jgi:hypothetical protein
MKVTEELDNRLEWAHATGNSRAAAVVVDEHGPVYGEVHVRQEEPDRFFGGGVARAGMMSWQVEAELSHERAMAVYGAGEVCTVRFGSRPTQIDHEGSAYAATVSVCEGGAGSPSAIVVTFVGNGPITQHAIDAPNDAT